jgi:hypothetical protein
MEINDATKLLAYSFVSELIKKKKIKKSGNAIITEGPDGEVSAMEGDIADVSFGDLENYYRNVVTIIENTPEIRQSIVDTLNDLKKQGKDLNDLYPARAVASETSLKQVLFMKAEE